MRVGEISAQAQRGYGHDDAHKFHDDVIEIGQQLPYRAVLSAAGGHTEPHDDGEDDEGQHVGLAPQLREITDRQRTHNHLRGGLGLAHLGGGQLDVGSGGGAEQVQPDEDTGGGYGSCTQENRHGAAQNLSQTVHIGHRTHSAGNGHKDKRHDYGEEQVQKNVSDGLQRLPQVRGNHADKRANGDAAKEKNGGLILLPKSLSASLCSHDTISISLLYPCQGAGFTDD